MRCRGSSWWTLGAALAVLALAAPCSGAIAGEPAAPPAAVREADVDAAIDEVAEDPLLAAKRTVRHLRWAGGEQETAEMPGWMEWLAELFGWLAEASRLFVWLLIAALVGLVLVYVTRLMKSLDRHTGRAAAAPTHVRDLDIRPESLPEDIGAAAWALWEQGEHREALALLYRGLLSRLVHEHGVPIRHSSTEGDSLALAERHLPRERHEYPGRLIRTWQRAVYGARDPQAAEVRLLCGEFAAALLPEAAPAEATA